MYLGIKEVRFRKTLWNAVMIVAGFSGLSCLYWMFCCLYEDNIPGALGTVVLAFILGCLAWISNVMASGYEFMEKDIEKVMGEKNEDLENRT